MKSLILLTIMTSVFTYAGTKSTITPTKLSIEWPGYITDSFIIGKDTCYTVVETLTKSNHISIRKTHPDKNIFIACQTGKHSPDFYINKLVTISGNSVIFKEFTSKNKNKTVSYPLVQTSTIKVWHPTFSKHHKNIKYNTRSNMPYYKRGNCFYNANGSIDSCIGY